MSEKTELTFKQYLESKEKLREAIKSTPQRTAQYTVRKYCKLPIGESKDDRVYLSLKPKNKITVEWLYNDVDNPTPVSLKFEGVSSLTEDEAVDEQFLTFWSGSKLVKWLFRNAREDESSS